MLKINLKMFKNFKIKRFQNQLISQYKKIVNIIINKFTLTEIVILSVNVFLIIDFLVSILNNFKKEV